LKQLQGADVFIFFVESYGSIVLRKPAFLEKMLSIHDAFAAELAAHQMTVRSGQLDSSTYGGGSWLAHATFASGVSIKDGLEFAVLRQTEPAPRTLASFFAQAGYRTVLVQPGTTRTWPEGEVSGFQKKYYAPAFDYAGSPFGWALSPSESAWRLCRRLRLFSRRTNSSGRRSRAMYARECSRSEPSDVQGMGAK
jgi:hypothetical protein